MSLDLQARLPIESAQETALGKSGDEADEELGRYLASRFRVGELPAVKTVPLADEPCVALWRRWELEAVDEGAFAVLRRHLPQLAFPIRKGSAECPDYRAAMAEGADPRGLAAATGLELAMPSRLTLRVHPTPAGAIPVLSTSHRGDFLALVRALGKGNEPVELPDSLGAVMINGYTNWQRVERVRRDFAASPAAAARTWAQELERLGRAQPEKVQDRFVLLSEGPYSAVPAAELGLDAAAWLSLSAIVRREHEFAHYATRRLFGSMRSHLHDELIAEHAGLTAAFRRFDAEHFLRFVGLDAGRLRDGARALIYRGEPPLSAPAFAEICRLVRAAAFQVELFDRELYGESSRSLLDRLVAMASLASWRLDQLAAPDAGRRLLEVADRLARLLRGRVSQP